MSGSQLYHRYPNGDEVYMVGVRVFGQLPAGALVQAAPDDSGETLQLAWFDLSHLPPLSGNINRENMNVLRRAAGLSALALQAVPTPRPLTASYAQRLRLALPNIPFFVPAVQVGEHYAELQPAERFEDVAQRLAGGEPVKALGTQLHYGAHSWKMTAQFVSGQNPL